MGNSSSRSSQKTPFTTKSIISGDLTVSGDISLNDDSGADREVQMILGDVSNSDSGYDNVSNNKLGDSQYLSSHNSSRSSSNSNAELDSSQADNKAKRIMQKIESSKKKATLKQDLNDLNSLLTVTKKPLHQKQTQQHSSKISTNNNGSRLGFQI